MPFRLSYFLILLFSLSGCVSKPKSNVSISPNAKIGVIYLIDDNPKQVHIGTTVFHNFEKENVSNWNTIKALNTHIQKTLSKFKGYSIKNIEPTKLLVDHKHDIVTSSWDTPIVNEKLAMELKNIGHSNNVNFLLVVHPEYKELDDTTSLTASGYGIYTRCFVERCSSKPHANINSIIISTNSGHLLSQGLNYNYYRLFHLTNSSIRIESSDLTNNIPPEEVDKYKIKSLKVIQDSVFDAFQKAGFLSYKNLTKKKIN